MKLGNYFVSFNHVPNGEAFDLKLTEILVELDDDGNEISKERIYYKTIDPIEITTCDLMIPGEVSAVDGSVKVVSTFKGYSFLRRGDIFSKERGRKTALRRAIQEAGIPKEQRKEIWEAYRTSTKDPRWKEKKPKKEEKVSEG